ncbi:hypothetical protein ACFX2K_014494 [Malus domestica]
MSINLQPRLYTALITVNIDQVVVRYNVRNNGGMVEEVVEENNSVIVPLRAVHCCHDGVAGEDGRASAGEDRVEGHFGGSFEVSGVYECWSDISSEKEYLYKFVDRNSHVRRILL